LAENAESNKSIVREYVKVFNEHNPALAKRYFTADVKWHGGTLGTVDGIKNLEGLLVGFMAAFPDVYATEYDIAAEGNKVAVRFVVEGTHKGNFMGVAPTGNRVRWDAVDVYHLKDGKIVEEWAGHDIAAILYQLGAIRLPWLEKNR
jgi:predicted ester cyclase